MSLILEALRKSEAERRRGHAPDVATELPPVPAARTTALPGWWPMALLLAALALLAGWWGWRERPAPTFDPVTVGNAPPAAQAPHDLPPPPVLVARPAPAMPAPPAVAPIPVPPPAPGALAAPPAARPPAQQEPTAPQPASTPAVADIGATALPPVRLSMHMWDEAPARRFAIIDGQRMGEGDRKGDLQLVSIERDGVVVERNGVRARVPLP